MIGAEYICGDVAPLLQSHCVRFLHNDLPTVAYLNRKPLSILRILHAARQDRGQLCFG